MLKVSLRNLLVNKLRLFLTVAAVTVGVTFVSGTFVLSDTMVKAFGELYTGLTSGTDVVVKSEAAYEADVTTTGGQVRPLDESMVATVGEVPGVEVAEGSVFGFALVLDEDGDPIQPGGAPTIGTSLTRGPPSRRGGHASARVARPPARDEMALDARTAKKAGYELGDAVDVVLQDGRRTFTLVGDHRFRRDRQPAGRDARRVRPAHGPAGARQGGRRRRGRRHGRGRRRARASCATGSPRCSPRASRR